jgi:hypothetical protein
MVIRTLERSSSPAMTVVDFSTGLDKVGWYNLFEETKGKPSQLKWLNRGSWTLRCYGEADGGLTEWTEVRFASPEGVCY